MRTTVNIDRELLAEARARASSSGRTLNAVLEDALRAALSKGPPRDQPVELPTFAGGRLQAGVDLDDSAQLLDVMEADRA